MAKKPLQIRVRVPSATVESDVSRNGGKPYSFQYVHIFLSSDPNDPWVKERVFCDKDAKPIPMGEYVLAEGALVREGYQYRLNLRFENLLPIAPSAAGARSAAERLSA